MNKINSEKKYREDIDGLRGIAVLAVIFFHISPSRFPGGFIGVDIFFVISGYLITKNIVNEIENSGFSILRFYKKRILRIFPALLTVLIFVTLIGYSFLYSDEFKKVLLNVFNSSVFVINHTLANDTGYFASNSELNPLLHLWSLAVEEQFYLIWPILLLIIFKLKMKWSYAFLLLALISFYFNISLLEREPELAFFSSFTRGWEFIAGSFCLFDFGKIRRSTINSKSIDWFLHSLILILLILFLQLSKENIYPGWWALLPVSVTALIIKMSETHLNGHIILSNQVLIFVGKISFPFYLWHWPILSYLRIFDSNPKLLVRLFFVLLSLVLAIVTHFLIENKLRYSSRKYLASTLLILLLVIGISSYFYSSSIKYEVQNPLLDTHILNESKNCLAVFNKEDSLIDRCATNSENPKYVFWGDSHVGQYYQGLINSNIPVMVIFNGSCLPLDISFNRECDRKYQRIIEYLNNQKSIQVVVLGGFYGNYINPSNRNGSSNSNYEFLETYLNHSMPPEEFVLNKFKETILFLKKNGLKIGVLLDSTELDYFPKDCYSRKFLTVSLRSNKCENVQKSAVLNKQKTFRENSIKLTSLLDFGFFDPLDFLCNDLYCSPFLNKKLIYWDDNHLNYFGSLYMANHLTDWLVH